MEDNFTSSSITDGSGRDRPVDLKKSHFVFPVWLFI